MMMLLLLLRFLLLDDQQRLLCLLSLRIHRVARGGLARTGALLLLVAALALFPLSQLVDHSFDLDGGDVEAAIAAHLAFGVGGTLKERSGGRGAEGEATAQSPTGDDEPTANK